jgi:hypothetical protein
MYRVRWDDGSLSQVEHQHLQLVSVEEGSGDVGGEQTSTKTQISTDLSL